MRKCDRIRAVERDGAAPRYRLQLSSAGSM
jgi:hypothetical protein